MTAVTASPPLMANGDYQIEISSVSTASCNVQFNNDWSSVIEMLACAAEQILYDIGQLLSQYAAAIAGAGLTAFATAKILMLPIIRNLLGRLL